MKSIKDTLSKTIAATMATALMTTVFVGCSGKEDSGSVNESLNSTPAITTPTATTTAATTTAATTTSAAISDTEIDDEKSEEIHEQVKEDLEERGLPQPDNNPNTLSNDGNASEPESQKPVEPEPEPTTPAQPVESEPEPEHETEPESITQAPEPVESTPDTPRPAESTKPSTTTKPATTTTKPKETKPTTPTESSSESDKPNYTPTEFTREGDWAFIPDINDWVYDPDHHEKSPEEVAALQAAYDEAFEHPEDVELGEGLTDEEIEAALRKKLGLDGDD